MAAKIRPATALALGSLLCAGWVTAVPGPFAGSALPAANALPAASALPAANALPAASALPAAGAQTPEHTTTFHHAEATDWANPNARSTDPDRGINLQVRNISPRFLNPADTDPQTYTLRIRNTSPGTIRGLTLSLKTAPAAGSPAQVRTSLLSNSGEYPHSSPARPLQRSNGAEVSLGPGETADVDVRLFRDPSFQDDATTPNPENPSGETAGPAGALAPMSFGLPDAAQAGTYPLMFTLGGTPGAADGADGGGEAAGNQAAQGAELLAVTRATAVVTPEEKKNKEEGSGTSGTPLTFLWPIGGETHATPGAVGDAPEPAELYLNEDSLGEQLKEGGRLRTLLDSYRTALDGPQGTKIRESSCLAIDPDLLQTVERMAGGYRVGGRVPKPVEERKRLRDSWGDIFNTKDRSEPGTHDKAAAAWLGDLRDTTKESCTVALPYGGADINTTAQATGPTNPEAAAGQANGAAASGDAAGGAAGADTGVAEESTSAAWLSMHALGRGAATIHEILGTTPVANIAIPSSGYLTPEALPYLAAAKVDPASEEADLSRRFENTLKGQALLPTLDPKAPVTALVANNTVLTQQPAQTPEAAGEQAGDAHDPATQQADQQWNDRLLKLNEAGSLRALRYSGDLGTVLAATGAHPDTTGYSNPQSRFDANADSEATRMSSALAVLQQELASPEPILAVPPGQWEVNGQDATALLDYIEQAFATGQATPASLADALRPRGLRNSELALGEVTQPFADPGKPTEALAPQLATLADRIRSLTLMMANSRKIALTREQFTRPILADLARATSNYGTRNPAEQDGASQRAAARVAGAAETADTLRNSVTLLPPGNVFTRTSEAAPLIVAAQNGLPLPVPAKIRYRDTLDEHAGHPAEILESESQMIPARGSLTVPIDLGAADRRSDLDLWLASPKNKRISDSVQVSVHSSPNIPLDKMILLLTIIAGAGIGGKILLDRRRRRTRRR
ncbi:hypothetical protein QP140_07990 [Corynebacterium sp. UMB9976]|uniref:hypothetical protein n=1 Tax=Corynebacterium sp. UMB9976 TaxID=3046354 RepID=UPI00254CD6A2|nr:hypothetical protein [Corynebacterium sp. UMB9976]MDK6302528.1 hypothetical protein [Corynebacterium sp. UMB9976]